MLASLKKKETYETALGIYNIERNDPKMWEMVWNHEILSLFQMEKQSGIQGIALSKPSSVDDLATLNSVIRLMAQEKGAEQPLNKFARFKNDISLWYEEMDKYGLTKEEQELLEPVVKLSYDISESQEKFMQLVQMPECGGFNLTWADKLRKSIAKKNPAAYEELQREYFETVEKKGLSKNLCNYVWNVLVATSRGYGFNASHTLAYSLIALQEMNLAYEYPIMFWNCACLISDSGGAESDDEDESNLDQEEYFEEIEYDSMEDFGAEEDDVHGQEEDQQNDPGEHGFHRGQGGQQHHGEAEDNGREVLVHQIIRHGGLEVAVDLTQQNHTGGSGAGDHQAAGAGDGAALCDQQTCAQGIVFHIGEEVGNGSGAIEGQLLLVVDTVGYIGILRAVAVSTHNDLHAIHQHIGQGHGAGVLDDIDSLAGHIGDLGQTGDGHGAGYHPTG